MVLLVGSLFRNYVYLMLRSEPQPQITSGKHCVVFNGFSVLHNSKEGSDLQEAQQEDTTKTGQARLTFDTTSRFQ